MNELRKIKFLRFGSITYDAIPHVASSKHEVKGIVHKFLPGKTSDDLMRGLRVRMWKTKIIQARMLGQSKTALLTFEGDTVPWAVYFHGKLVCYHYRKTHQVCQNCMTARQQSDVCPTARISKCPQCGTENPTPEHLCFPMCTLCGEEGHVTGKKK